MEKVINLVDAIQELSQERDIDKETVIKALEEAMVMSAKKKYELYEDIEARFENNDIHLYQYKKVVKDIEDKDNQISLQEAKKIDVDAQIDDEIEYEIKKEDYESVIGQTMRQAFFQKLREYENQIIKESYQDQVHEIITGIIGQVSKQKCIVNLKKNVSAILEQKEQIPFEKLVPGEPIRSYLVKMETEGTRTSLKLSRTHPEFLRKLFELEVPEIEDKTIEIVSIARDPGKRAKIAVKTNNSDVDPVGSIVGKGGERIQTVVNELNGEKIDVIRWSEDFEQIIMDALTPAEISRIEIDEANSVANIFVDMENLALAIGKKGQNVRLASKLTHFELNIRMLEEEKSDKEDVPELQLFADDSKEEATEVEKES